MSLRHALLASILFCGAITAHADEPPSVIVPVAPAPVTIPMPALEPLPVERYGQTNACVEWTDGCMVCRKSSDELACSTRGPACVPAEIVCRIKP